MTDTPEGAPSKRAMEIGKAIGEQILDDVTDRRGWRQAWDSFDDGIRQEVRDVFTEIAARLLDAEFRNGEELAKAVEPFAAVFDDYEANIPSVDEHIIAGRITRKEGEAAPRVTYGDLRSLSAALAAYRWSQP